MVISGLLLVATVYCFRIIPTGFIPSQDTGQLQGQTEMVQGIGFESMMAHQQEIIRIIREDPNVLSVTSTIGGGGPGGNTTGGRVSMELKPRSERTLTADEVIDRLEQIVRGKMQKHECRMSKE